MPIPNPNKKETKEEFISRCMSELKDEYEQNQRIAICLGKWKK
jgi:hypothetical protein